MELDLEPGYGEIGYWVVAEARGRGVATRAVRLLADWARDELALTRSTSCPTRTTRRRAGWPRRPASPTRASWSARRGRGSRSRSTPAMSGSAHRLRRADVARWQYPGSMDVELTYCVVNTEQRQLLSYCLDAIARERATVEFETETLVLDNASRDGSAATARAPRRDDRGDRARPAARPRRERHRAAAARARALLPDPQRGLRARAGRDRGAARRARAAPGGRPRRAPRWCARTALQQPSAWRFPSPWTGVLSRLGLGRRFVVQSHGRARPRRRLGAGVRAAGAARGGRRRRVAATATRCGFCRRLRAAGWRVLYVPEARAVEHHEVARMSARAERVEQRVTPLELFFDLVFVFAITRVTTLMAHDLSWTTIGQGLLVLAALWWGWAAFAWLTNHVAGDDGPRAARGVRGHGRDGAGRARGAGGLRRPRAAVRARLPRDADGPPRPLLGGQPRGGGGARRGRAAAADGASAGRCCWWPPPSPTARSRPRCGCSRWRSTTAARS